MKKITLFVAALISAAQAFSATITVPGDYGTIKAAITAAASGDMIEVGAGTFIEKNITFPTISTVITPKSITIKGAGISQTTIQAYATPNNIPTSSSSVFNLDGFYSSPITVTLQDMTIENGFNSSNGGGIRVTNTGTVAPTLNFTNLKIANNVGVTGGGIFISGPASTIITGCNLTGNTASSTTAGNGGGIYISPGTNKLLSATIKQSTISLNTSGYLGGGIMVQCAGDGTNGGQLDHSLILENTTIYKNSCITALKSGGGIEFRQAGSSSVLCSHTVNLNHCTIVGNTTNGGLGGDGVCFENNYNVTLVMNNSIIMGNSGSVVNTAGTAGANTSYPSQIGIFSSSQAKLINGGVNNSIFGIINGGTWGTGTNNTVSTPSTTGALDMNTILTNLAFPTLDALALSSDATPVLKIGVSSTAKDYVVTDAAPLTLDQLGITRNGAADAGAYEYPADVATALVSTISNQSMIVTKNGCISKAKGTLKIYTFNGQLLNTLKVVDGQFINLPTGTYLLRLISEKGTCVEKLSL